MPTPTYTPLANLTLSSSQATVTFSSISQAYRDLVLIVRSTSTSASGGFFRFNSDSGSNYSSVWAYGNGGSAGSSSQTTTAINIQGAYGGTTAIDIWNVMDYSATDKHKTVLNRMDSPQELGAWMQAGRWANTAAVTTITITANAGSWASGSSFAIYGIAS